MYSMGIDWRANALRCCLWGTSNAKLVGAGRGDGGRGSRVGKATVLQIEVEKRLEVTDVTRMSLLTNISCEGLRTCHLSSSVGVRRSQATGEINRGPNTGEGSFRGVSPLLSQLSESNSLLAVEED